MLQRSVAGKKFMLVSTGFTLIELLVVIAILGILAAVVLVAINPAQRIAEANDTQTRSNVSQVATAIEACFTQNTGSYTNCNSAAAGGNLVTGGYLKNGIAGATIVGPSGTPAEVLVYGTIQASSAACASGSGALKFYVYRSRTGVSRVECLASGTPATP